MLASWSIGTRIYVGFAIVLTLLTGLAVFTFMSMTTVTKMFGEYRSTARQTLYVTEFVENLAEGRMAVMKYRANPSEATAQEVSDSFAGITTATTKVGEFFERDTQTQATLRALGERGAEYKATFEAAQAARDRFDEGLAPMVPAAQAAGGAIDDLNQIGVERRDFGLVNLASNAQRDFLLARNHTTKFVDRADLAELTAAQTQLTATLTTLQEISQRWPDAPQAETAAAAAAEIGFYLDRLEILAAESSTLRDLNATLNALGPEMNQAYDKVFTNIVERQNTLGPEASAVISGTRTTSIVVGVGALVVGLTLAFAIGRWIAGAVQRMAQSMNRMAEGDLTMEVTGDQHKHELGQMASALKIFQENGIEKRRLDEEQRAAAAREQAAAKERADLQSDVSTVVQSAADGDFGKRVNARYNDETLNGFAGMMNSLLETVSKGVDETVKVMAALAHGDLNTSMTGSYRGAFAELQTNVNGTVEKLRSTVREIQTTSDQIRTATGEIAQGAGDLSSRAENQAASLEEIAATMEEMSATVKKNAENAVSASNLSADARERADKGGSVVSQAVTAMSKIEEGSGKIADIVSVIDGFAFQTNLLALNAAVEAARAGEAGKGFAVVASEVRTLAQRSAEAARDIKSLIDESAHNVTDGVRLVTETGDSLSSIVDAIRQVSDTITEISEASREQSSGVDEITAAITSMDEITQQNSALADESASAAKGLGDQAKGMETLMAFFKVSGGLGAQAAAWDADAAADRHDAAVVAAE